MVFDSLKEKLQNMGGSGTEEDDGPEFQIQSASEDLVVIPDQENIREVDVRYSLIAPFTDAHISWDEDQEELVYKVEEPTLNEDEQAKFDQIKNAMERKIDVSLDELDTTDKQIDYLGGKLDDVTKELGIRLSDQERAKLMYFVYRNFAGLNEIEPLMHDPYIEDIGCSGLGIPTYIVHTKFGSIKTDLVFEDEDNLKNLVVKLAERCGKYISYSDPLLDGSLPDGSRVNASLTQDVTTKGPTFSIRKFQETPYSAIDLIDMDTANFEIMAYFWFAMEYQKSVLVSGGTATGKTTFLNSIVTFIPPEQKIVSIEDTRELQLPHENWIPSVAREGFGSGSGDSEEDVTMYKLLKESFRQNPDYVVVGEVRGEEASVLFQGMSSGHPSLGTIHASSPNDVVKRLTTPPINLSPSLVETLDIVVIMTKARQYGENARRVKGVYEVEAITPEGSPRTNEYISWTPIDDTFSFKKDSNILSEIKQQYGFSQQELEEELENRKRVLEWMKENGYTNFSEVARIVSEYYKDKDSVLDAIDKASEEAVFEEVVGTPSEGRSSAMPADLQSAQQQLADAKQESKAAEKIKEERKDEIDHDTGPGPGTGPENPVPPEERGEETDAPAGRTQDRSSDPQADQGTDAVRDETGEQQEAIQEQQAQQDGTSKNGKPSEDELFGDAEQVDENPFDD